MHNIVNWERYNSLYNLINEEEFEKYEKLAEIEVRNVIGIIRFANITVDTFGYEQLQDCICKVMNALKANEDSAVGKGISSVSNDGYSESYSVTNPEDLRADLKSIIVSALSGSGLVGAY